MIVYLIRTLVSGIGGTLSSTAMLAAAARLEGQGVAQPLNATSHWLHGDAASRRPSIDLAHTGMGLVTHTAATVFWASLFEAWMVDRPSRSRGEIAARAVTVAALAAVVDYTVTPKRFTPGWEMVLSKQAMAAAYFAMAAGFAASRLSRPS